MNILQTFKMKTKNFLIGAFALGLVLVATGANAYVGLGVSDNSVLPSAADFNWVNNIGTLTWTTGEGTIDIVVRVSAPDGDSGNFGSDDYGSYYPDPLYGSFRAYYDTVTTETSGTFSKGWGGGGRGYDPTTGTTFDNVYGYFYTITLDYGWNSLSSFGFNMGPATITEIGYDRSEQGLVGWEISEGNTLLFNFPTGRGRFRADETASVYVASEYWWGWSEAKFEGAGGTGGYNNTGNLPAPNPEAPTVALFMLGIFGLHVWRNKGLRFMAKSQ